jgi:rhamnosyl/mannosyltransferase
MTNQSKMLIIHVASHYPPFLGGTEKVVESLALAQSQQGWSVHVLTSRDSRSLDDGSPSQDYVQRLAAWDIAHTAIIPGLLRQLLRKPRGAVVHLHIAQAFVPEMVYAAHLLRGLPYVAQLHLDVGPSGKAGFLLRVYKPLILKRVLRGAARVVVFSQEQRAAVAAKYSVDAARIAVVPNGVDDVFLHTGPRFPHLKPRLLFVGRLSVQKNLPQLLRALDGISDQFETTLVGEGELEAQLRQAARDLGLKNVQFHGRADGPELRELYRNADVFVLPSEREGMPLVLLEALAMGLPIVATDVPGNRDLVSDGQNGLLIPLGDAAALRQALLSFTTDPERYRRMSETSRRRAERYSWQAVSAEFEQIYAQVAGRAQEPSTADVR